jgi:hypothetical protein
MKFRHSWQSHEADGVQDTLKKLNLRNYFFSVRVVKKWNSLPVSTDSGAMLLGIFVTIIEELYLVAKMIAKDTVGNPLWKPTGI